MKVVCKHPQRWMPGFHGKPCRDCPLLGLGGRYTAPELADTQDIPVYQEPPTPAWMLPTDTRPMPVIRDNIITPEGNPRGPIRPDKPTRTREPKSSKLIAVLGKLPKRKGKRKSKPGTISPKVWFFLISLVIAIILYQLPMFGHP